MLKVIRYIVSYIVMKFIDIKLFNLIVYGVNYVFMKFRIIIIKFNNIVLILLRGWLKIVFVVFGILVRMISN